MTTESIPLETIQFSEPDIYGQVHPNETEELIAAKIREFESVVEKISDKKKKCLLQAQIRCPELLTDDFKLCFLRCDLFDAKVRYEFLLEKESQRSVVKIIRVAYHLLRLVWGFCCS